MVSLWVNNKIRYIPRASVYIEYKRNRPNPITPISIKILLLKKIIENQKRKNFWPINFIKKSTDQVKSILQLT